MNPKPNLPRQNGPISTPATRYAVTAGKPIFFASRESKRPDNKANESVKRTSVVPCISKTSFLRIFLTSIYFSTLFIKINVI